MLYIDSDLKCQEELSELNENMKIWRNHIR